MLMLLKERRTYGLTVLWALFLSCDRQAVRNRAEPATLSGEVFTITRDGEIVRASGRTVNIVIPTRRSLDAADSTCGSWRAVQSDLIWRTPMEKYLEAKERIRDAAAGDVMRSADTGDLVATVTADLKGEFQLTGLAPGRYMFWTKTDVGDNRIYWLAYATVREGVANRVILGTDASDWQEMCNAIVSERQDIATSTSR
jgi:hypothetical protein